MEDNYLDSHSTKGLDNRNVPCFTLRIVLNALKGGLKYMSERYGDCKRCKGEGHVYLQKDKITAIECPSCDGTGHSGDAIDYIQLQADKDWEREQSYGTYWEREI